MSERDRQNPYDRSQQQGGGYRGNDHAPRQANQWQAEDDRQQGGYWQQDGGGDTAREYRFSEQGNASYDAGYQSGQGEDGQRGYRSQSGSRGSQDRGRYEGDYGPEQYGRGQYGRGQSGRNAYGQGQSGGSSYDRDTYAGGRYGRGSQDRGQQASREPYGRGQPSTPYAGRDYDASGGNDFGSFTGDDFGGRDFSRGSGGGGMRSSESYRPTYSAARLFDHDGDDQRGRGDGQNRGFLARAGDEVASWFGDEDASRRREQDHRGRGPSGYTRSDERIRDDANDHLTQDWGVDASDITVSVSNGEITLDGTVDSRQSKRRAEDCVENISSVKHVQNNLRVAERSGGYGGASAYGNSGSSSGQSGSSYGASAGQGTNRSDAASSTSGASTTPSSTSGSASATGASTTSGIGSTATAGVGSASASRASDKTD
jgi:hypothetical protein